MPEIEGAARGPRSLHAQSFYQCYAAAALAAGAEPLYVPATAGQRLSARLSQSCPKSVLDRDWRRSISARPPIPKARCASEAYWRTLFALAERHDFIVLADECYADIYFDKPPVCALPARLAQSAASTRLLTFHSLSKRSGLPGLRSGMVAGDAKLIAKFRAFRNVAGPQVPTPILAASAAAWRDEAHVAANRAAYRGEDGGGASASWATALASRPEGGFFLWLEVGNGEETALRAVARSRGSGCCPAPIWAGKLNPEKPSQTLAFPISGWLLLAIYQPL